MNKLTTIASLPGSGSGCMSALPAETGEKAQVVKSDFPLLLRHDAAMRLADDFKIVWLMSLRGS